MYSKGIQVKPSTEEDPDMPCSQARMGKWVPNFVGETTEGVIDFHQWLGTSWGILFSHPAPFTPICTTEMGAMAAEYEVIYIEITITIYIEFLAYTLLQNYRVRHFNCQPLTAIVFTVVRGDC